MSNVNLKTFFSRVSEELIYFADGDHTFDEYLQLSHSNSRIRNAFLFYLLSNSEYQKRFWKLSELSIELKRYKASLHRALNRVEEHPFNRSETKQLANILRKEYFVNEKIVDDKITDEMSEKMEKFFTSVVNLYMSDVEDTEEDKEYRNSILKDVDFNKLIDE